MQVHGLGMQVEMVGCMVVTHDYKETYDQHFIAIFNDGFESESG